MSNPLQVITMAHGSGGELVPLSNLVRFDQQVEPSKRTQFQQLNSVTVEGIMTPGVSLGDALGYLETEAKAMFPSNVHWDFAGQARQFAQQGGALVATFFLSLLIIYLVLAAVLLFGSFVKLGFPFIFPPAPLCWVSLACRVEPVVPPSFRPPSPSSPAVGPERPQR